MQIVVTRDTEEGGFRQWVFRVLPADDDQGALMALDSYLEFDGSGDNVMFGWLREGSDDVEVPAGAVISAEDARAATTDDVIAEARASSLDQARAAIRAYVLPVELPTD